MDVDNMRSESKSLDESALRDACAEVARSTMWEQRPVDVDTIDDVTNELFSIVIEQLEWLPENRDPNLLVRAVRHLGQSHAIPPMRGDTTWFSDMLSALLGIACPTDVNRPLIHFLNDVTIGIAEARMEWNARSK